MYFPAFSPPDSSEYASLVLRLMEDGEFQQAWELGESFLRHHSTDRDLKEVCGISAAMAGNLKAARRHFRNLLKIAPRNARYWSHLGNVHFLSGEIKQAAIALHRAAIAEPGNVVHLVNLGLVEASLGNLEKAEAAFLRVLTARPDDLIALLNLARVYMNRGHHYNAMPLMRRASQVVSESDPDFWVEYGTAALPVLDVVAIAESIEHLKAIASDNAEVQAHVALLYSSINKRMEALCCAHRVLDLQPNSTEIIGKAAEILAEYGEIDESVRIYRNLIYTNPDCSYAYFRLAHLIDFSPSRTEDRRLIDCMEALLEQSPKDPQRVHFALAKAYDDIDDADNAFRHLVKGNGLCRQLYPYRAKGDVASVRNAKRMFPETSGYGELASVPEDELSPIFIVGMPRSGTTLVEQITAAHPGVAACGELPLLPSLLAAHKLGDTGTLSRESWNEIGAIYRQQVRAAAGGRLRATDKLPANLFNVGAIWTALPDARIILVQRDPMAVGLSCYQTLFGKALEFSYDLKTIGTYIGLSDDLSDHWMQIAPHRMLIVRYEDLVRDSEFQTRRILDFCQLDWHPDCERFYEAGNRISTASLNQANRPIYRDSVDRWKSYEKHLGPLAAAISAQ